MWGNPYSSTFRPFQDIGLCLSDPTRARTRLRAGVYHYRPPNLVQIDFRTEIGELSKQPFCFIQVDGLLILHNPVIDGTIIHSVPFLEILWVMGSSEAWRRGETARNSQRQQNNGQHDETSGKAWKPRSNHNRMHVHPYTSAWICGSHFWSRERLPTSAIWKG